MIQFQCANIPGTQSQPACQQENGVISFAFSRTAIDRPEQLDDELVIPHRGDTGISGNTDGWQLRTEILLEDPTHGKEPKKGPYIGDDSRDGVLLQVTPRRQEFGQIQRLNLVQGPCFPRIQKIQKDREFSGARSKSRWPKLESILTVLFVVTKCILHGWKKVDLFQVGESTFDTAVLRKLLKRLYTKHDMPSPSLARLVCLFIPASSGGKTQ